MLIDRRGLVLKTLNEQNGAARSAIRRCLLLLLLLVVGIEVAAQGAKAPDKSERLPKQVRGYEVQRAQVELKKSKGAEKEVATEVEEILIRLGAAHLVEVTPLGVTFEAPAVLAAVKQEGNIDRLVFEDMRVNETPVTIEDYVHPFKLPNKEALTLAPPLRVFVSTPQAVLRTVDEFLNSKEVWPVTGRIYVCGHFKKLLLKFKRAVPVDIQASINNPLK